MPDIIDNKLKKVGDSLKESLCPGATASLATQDFSMYAYHVQILKQTGINDVRSL